MKLPMWFKVGWWLILFGLLTLFLYGRYPDLKAGNASLLDNVALLIWIALALAPIFQEINLFGIKLRQQFDELKQHISQQVSNLQTEIRTSVRTEFNPQITFPYPPPDSQLPQIEE